MRRHHVPDLSHNQRDGIFCGEDGDGGSVFSGDLHAHAAHAARIAGLCGEYMTSKPAFSTSSFRCFWISYGFSGLGMLWKIDIGRRSRTCATCSSTYFSLSICLSHASNRNVLGCRDDHSLERELYALQYARYAADANFPGEPHRIVTMTVFWKSVTGLPGIEDLRIVPRE